MKSLTTTSPELALYPNEEVAPLDLFSISQKTSVSCTFGAPYFAYEKTAKTWVVLQGCCNHWDCPRCGQQRAREEYGRIVEGCRQIEQTHELYFITITCGGKEVSVEEGMENYLLWTNRLFSTWRADAAKRGVKWSYVQVTEFQKRGHPHSHILTTYHPDDLTIGLKNSSRLTETGTVLREVKEVLRSAYMQKTVMKTGLGEQYDISHVLTIEGASRYVAKYLFKPTMFSKEYPKSWRRVRYSHSFPKLPKKKSDAVCLLKSADWSLLARKAAIVETVGLQATAEVQYQLRGSDCIIQSHPDKARYQN